VALDDGAQALDLAQRARDIVLDLLAREVAAADELQRALDRRQRVGHLVREHGGGAAEDHAAVVLALLLARGLDRGDIAQRDEQPHLLEAAHGHAQDLVAVLGQLDAPAPVVALQGLARQRHQVVDHAALEALALEHAQRGLVGREHGAAPAVHEHEGRGRLGEGAQRAHHAGPEPVQHLRPHHADIGPRPGHVEQRLHVHQEAVRGRFVDQHPGRHRRVREDIARVVRFLRQRVNVKHDQVEVEGDSGVFRQTGERLAQGRKRDPIDHQLLGHGVLAHGLIGAVLAYVEHA